MATRKPATRELATLTVHAGGPTDGTPNIERVQDRVAALEGSEAAILLSSGMAATACALLALLRPGDHLIASTWIPPKVEPLLVREFAALGIEVTCVDPTTRRVWRKHLRKETRAVYLASPAGPAGRLIDLRPVSYVTQDVGIACVVDSTLAGPVAVRPLAHGADVVIHSSTGLLGGDRDARGGLVCGTASYIDEVRAKMSVWGSTPDPFAAWLLERGLRTLDVRCRRQHESALRIAEWCDDHQGVKRVHHAGLANHPDHEIAAATMEAAGSLVGLELAGGARAADRFLRKLRLIRIAPGFGGPDTTVYKAKADGFLRLSIGIESANDLIGDIEQALH
jgi:cystathionine beta-lyase/cystathionine gamma-synthase